MQARDDSVLLRSGDVIVVADFKKVSGTSLCRVPLIMGEIGQNLYKPRGSKGKPNLVKLNIKALLQPASGRKVAILSDISEGNVKHYTRLTAIVANFPNVILTTVNGFIAFGLNVSSSDELSGAFSD